MPEIALAKVSPEAPLDGAPLCLRPVHRDRRRSEHGAGRGGLDRGRLRLRPRRPRGGDRARLAGAERIIALDLSGERLEQAGHHGATDTRPADQDTVEWIRSETDGFGADYTFEATGNVAVMRQAVEAAREAWGLATMCGVAGKGEVLEVVPRS
jgi:S-(hydroxymethyl)glutathione dehydrogenase/alcohol dehydrogenase